MLVQRVGENADTLVELLEMLEVVDDLVGDLLPELKTVVRENRETIARIRVALEREETLTLLERLGENEETLIELLELLDVTYELAEDLVPEAVAVVQENRQPITELRMMVAGFSHAYTDADLEPYQLGQNLGNMLALGCRLGDEELINSVESGLGAFTEDEPPKRSACWGCSVRFATTTSGRDSAFSSSSFGGWVRHGRIQWRSNPELMGETDGSQPVSPISRRLERYWCSANRFVCFVLFWPYLPPACVIASHGTVFE